MSSWSWVLVGLSAAGVLLAAVSAVVVLIAAIRLGRRLSALGESPLVVKLESLQIQAGRLARSADDIHELERRVKTATESLRHIAETSGFKAVRESWRNCAAQVRAIVSDLS